MPELDAQQQARAIEAMKIYLQQADLVASDTELDKSRRSLIAEKLKPLLDNYIADEMDIMSFRSMVDSSSKRHNHWGFKGVNGQMFFNMIAKTAVDLEECDAELKAVLAPPESEPMARSRMRTFASYVARIGEEHVNSGGSVRSKPKVGSTPYFVSHFWQIYGLEIWPIYYTSGVRSMVNLNLWSPNEDFAEGYIEFKRIMGELQGVFENESGQTFDLYHVEHVLWSHGENPLTGEKIIGDVGEDSEPLKEPEPPREKVTLLPESYVPPIIAILPQMAAHEPSLDEAAKASGISLARAFEKNINAAFTILGYETKLLGQGQGRVPDGQALNSDDAYAVLWDAKVRAGAYSIGTDDRTIREYIASMARELKRRQSMRNFYYAIISSTFVDDFDEAVRFLKMETDVNEVCLIEAEALVAMVDIKMRDPLGVSLGPDGLQRLFTSSGILSADSVQEVMG